MYKIFNLTIEFNKRFIKLYFVNNFVTENTKIIRQ